MLAVREEPIAVVQGKGCASELSRSIVQAFVSSISLDMTVVKGL